MTSLLGDLSGQIVADVAAGRRLSATAVQAAVDSAPHNTAAAAQLGLIDGGLYRDQAARIVGRLGELKRQSLAGVAAAAAKSKELQSLLETVVEDKGKGEERQPVWESGQEAQEEGRLSKVQWRERDEMYESAARALLEQPDVESERKLRRVPLAKYVRIVEAKQAERQKQRQVDMLQQVRREKGGGVYGHAAANTQCWGTSLFALTKVVRPQAVSPGSACV